MHPRYVAIERERVRRLYVDERLTTIEIAARLGCGPTTIRRRLKGFGIATRHRRPDPVRWSQRPTPGLDTGPVWSSGLAYAVGLITTDGNLGQDGRHLAMTSNSSMTNRATGRRAGAPAAHRGGGRDVADGPAQPAQPADDLPALLHNHAAAALEWAQYLSNVDYERRLALVAADPHTSDLVGVARYETTSDARTVEVAFVVQDSWQNRGLGTSLFGELLRAAVMNGIDRFRAWVLVDNRRMLDLIARFGIIEQRRMEQGVIEVTFTAASGVRHALRWRTASSTARMAAAAP